MWPSIETTPIQFDGNLPFAPVNIDTEIKDIGKNKSETLQY